MSAYDPFAKTRRRREDDGDRAERDQLADDRYWAEQDRLDRHGPAPYSPAMAEWGRTAMARLERARSSG